MFKFNGSRGITAQAPRNYGRAEKYMPVQQELDHTIARANRQYLEAIAVDGIPIQYWRRTTEGKFCTCHSGKPSQQNHLNEVSAAPVDTRLNDDQDDDSTIFKVRGAREIKETRRNQTGEAFGAVIGELPPDDDGKTKGATTFDDSWDELEKLADDEAFQKMGIDSAILFGGERTQCGICFGTGHVNGYSLVNGQRIVLDASNSIPVTVKGFYLDTNQHPHTFVAPADTNCYVEFSFPTPCFFEKIVNFRIFNNVKEVANIAVDIKRESVSDFTSINSSVDYGVLNYLNETRNNTSNVIIRIRPAKNDLETLVQFTHAELVYQLSPWPKAQIPAVSEATNFGVFDSLMTTEFTLPPTLNVVDKEDVIYEYKHNQIWKITDYTDFMTAKQQVCGWMANARLIQQFEQLSILKLTTEKPYNHPYSHIEPFQGRDNRGNDGV